MNVPGARSLVGQPYPGVTTHIPPLQPSKPESNGSASRTDFGDGKKNVAPSGGFPCSGQGIGHGDRLGKRGILGRGRAHSLEAGVGGACG